MEASTQTRELTGEKATRIVEAMRNSVAKRGIAGSTFEHVAREAGVSRGLLHYYFGTKERLLVEVVRRDTDMRVTRLDEPLAAAKSVDDVLALLVSSLLDWIEGDPGYFVLLFDLFTAGRRTPDVQRELAELFNRTRFHVVEIFEGLEREGVIKMSQGPAAVVGALFALGDGLALQVLADPERDHKPMIEAATVAARALLTP
jgi:AcrR family transcriptional regulator